MPGSILSVFTGSARLLLTDFVETSSHLLANQVSEPAFLRLITF